MTEGEEVEESRETIELRESKESGESRGVGESSLHIHQKTKLPQRIERMSEPELEI